MMLLFGTLVHICEEHVPLLADVSCTYFLYSPLIPASSILSGGPGLDTVALHIPFPDSRFLFSTSPAYDTQKVPIRAELIFLSLVIL